MNNQSDVEESWYGSYLNMAILISLPLAAFSVPLAVLGSVRWVFPIGLVAGAFTIPLMLRPYNRVTVLKQCIVFKLGIHEICIPWSEVEGIKGHWYGASLILKHPRKIGFISRRRMALCSCDLAWKSRPTVVAAMSRLNTNPVD